MNLNRKLMSLTVVALLGFAVPAIAAEGEWKKLLDGELKEHWTTEGNWKLEDGVVTLTPRQGESGWTRYGSYLWLEGDYQDFEISFDYKVQKGGNSGFYFHVGDVKEPVATGIEVQIYDSGSKAKDAKLTDHDSGGVIPGIPPTKNTAKPAGEWNTMEIAIDGQRTIVHVNGVLVTDYDGKSPVPERVHPWEPQRGPRPDSGYIGVQGHDDRATFYFKEISVTPLR